MAASVGMQAVGVRGGVAGPMCRAMGQADPVPPSLGQERVCPPGGMCWSRDALGLGCRGQLPAGFFFLGAGVHLCGDPEPAGCPFELILIPPCLLGHLATPHGKT